VLDLLSNCFYECFRYSKKVFLQISVAATECNYSKCLKFEGIPFSEILHSIFCSSCKYFRRKFFRLNVLYSHWITDSNKTAFPSKSIAILKFEYSGIWNCIENFAVVFRKAQSESYRSIKFILALLCLCHMFRNPNCKGWNVLKICISDVQQMNLNR
jgi:hypothetical protein